MIKTISFDEIVKGRDATVRVTDDDLLYAVDLVMVMNGSERDQAGLTLRRLPEKLFPSNHWIERKTQGKGNAHTKLVNFTHGIELVMVLTGDTARATRIKFADILRRYAGGDRSLIKEINQNATSNEPINVMARNSMEKSESSDEEQMRKRRLERSDALEELEIQERTIAIQERISANNAAIEERLDSRKKEALLYVQSSMDLLKSITGKPLDERTSLQCEDLVRNMLFSSKSITNGEPATSDGLTVSVVAIELGFTGKFTPVQLCAMGRIMANQYRMKYSDEPAKHRQYVNGAVVQVKSYTERDRDMLEQVIKDYMGSPPPPKGAKTKLSKPNM